MPANDRGSGRRRVPVHLVQWLLLGLAALLPLRPPAVGAMTLLPLNGAATGETLAWALRHDARLLAAGPYPGSVIVTGSRSALIGPALSHATLILAAPRRECSSEPRESDNA